MEWFFDLGYHLIHLAIEIGLLLWKLLPKELPEVFKIED